MNMLGAGGLNHLPYLLSISVSLAVIKDFSTNYIKALGLNQAYILFKLRNNYCIMLICSFGSLTGNILQLYTKSFYVFSLFGLHGWFSIDTENDF